jgi:hypothetical protein
MESFWRKQRPDEALFPDLLWSRPQNKRTAGKLLIVGGNSHSFAAPAEAYGQAVKSGVGTSRVLLPDSIQKLVGGILENIEFAASTRPSGGFSKQSLGEFLDHAKWADGILIAGDLGKNSETVVLLEQFAEKYKGQLTITKDAADDLIKSAQTIVERPNTLLVITLAQLQKLGINAKFTKAFTFDMDLVRLIDGLHEFTSKHKVNIILKHLNQLIVASGGQVSTTNIDKPMPIWRVQTAAASCVWWLQNPTKTFESLTTAIYEMNK